MILETERPEIREPIGVLGFGVEGKSTCAYLLARGFKDITVFDRKAPEGLDPRLKYAAQAAGETYLAGISGMRTLFRSAGIRPDLPEIEALLGRGGTLTSQIGLAFSLAGRDRIIGVTGTLGKGTACSLLHAMLAQAGIKAKLGGNIGVPALDLAASLEKDEFLILELSSFQLSALPASPAVAVALRTTSEHLDWHVDNDEYWRHKANIAAHQGAKDLLVYCADAPGSAWIATQSRARKIAFGSPARDGNPAPEVRIEPGPGGGAVAWVTRGLTIPLSATRLKGAFNLENVAAAGTVALELGASAEAVRAAAAAFAGLEHRLEFVRETRGIAFYNDSYATRPEASMGAVAALSDKPLGLVLGGSEKHADFRDLAVKIASSPHVRALALIGETRERIHAELLRACGDNSGGGSGDAQSATTRAQTAALPFDIRLCRSLEEAMEFLLAAIPGGYIALSPACASFGLFENYKERGKAFKRMVQAL
jgi:UDP-N-acetylmuramoylalanine--D-glutamate ligase